MNAPTSYRDLSDPGDEVLRRFRYQHAYGVILAIGIAKKLLDYTAIWCEQHEDFIAETGDGKFDAYQVKTRKAELGEWEINDEAFSGSISRFIALDLKFPNLIRAFKFVSDCKYSDSTAIKRELYSPLKLVNCVSLAAKYSDLTGEGKKGFDWLLKRLETEREALFSVLKRLELILGPTERAFEDELCQRHIASLETCKSMPAPRLAAVLEALIAWVARASSLVSRDPSKDWVSLTGDFKIEPLLLAKKITAKDIILIVREVSGPRFNFLPELASIELGAASTKLNTLRAKMIFGGMDGHYEAMRRRTLTAEQELLDLVTRPDDGKKVLSQIENVVLSECDDAYLRASQVKCTFGSQMMIDVQDRLKRISEMDPSRVYSQSYDLLVGVAGLLTSECKVWWSEQFPLKEWP